jgi:hypothetical protein
MQGRIVDPSNPGFRNGVRVGDGSGFRSENRSAFNGPYHAASLHDRYVVFGCNAPATLCQETQAAQKISTLNVPILRHVEAKCPSVTPYRLRRSKPALSHLQRSLDMSRFDPTTLSNWPLTQTKSVSAPCLPCVGKKRLYGTFTLDSLISEQRPESCQVARFAKVV